MSATPPTGNAQPKLLLETGSKVYSIPEALLHSVIRLDTWSPVPAAPRYTLGTLEHEGRLHTLIDPDHLSVDRKETTNPAQADAKTQQPKVAVVLASEHSYPCILVGQRIRPQAAALSEWTPVAFPQALLYPGAPADAVAIESSSLQP